MNADALLKGFRDDSSGGKLLMTEEDIRAMLNAYQRELMQKRVQAMQVVAEENKKMGMLSWRRTKKRKAW